MNHADFPQPLKFPNPGGEPEVIEVEGNWQIFAGKSSGSSNQSETGVPPAPGRLLEAALFVASKPINHDQLTRLFPGWKAQEIENLFAQVNQTLRQQGRPYRAVLEQGGWIFRLLAESMPKRGEVRQNPGEVELLQEAVDVLALVAYRQPIAREEMDAIRGADSSGVVRRLMRLGLIRMDSEPSGKMYRTTEYFLELLGINNLKDLPRVEEAG